MAGEDKDDRLNAAFALHRMGKPALERALVLVGSPNSMVREMSCVVLGRVLDTAVHQDIAYPTYYLDGVPALRDRLRNDPEPRVKLAAAVALSFLNQPETIDDLCLAARDSDVFVRFGAAQAFANFSLYFWDKAEVAARSEKVEEALLGLATDVNDEVRSWTAMAMGHAGRNNVRIHACLEELTADTNEEVAVEARDALDWLREEEQATAGDCDNED